MFRQRPKLYVIYVPGIKDDLLCVQSALIQLWRLQGVRPVMFVMPWSGPEAFAGKLARLVSKIDKYSQQGHSVCLVGASAGASAVLQAYSLRKAAVQSVAYICGKINHPESVSDRTYAQNPAFKVSLLQLQDLLEQFHSDDVRKFYSFYSPTDTTVPYVDTVLKGVTEQKLPAVGHMWAVLYALSFGSRKLLQALRSKSEEEK